MAMRISPVVKDLISDKQAELDALAQQYQIILDSWTQFVDAANNLSECLSKSSLQSKDAAKICGTKVANFKLGAA